jgi:hypothetical protein
MPLASSGAAQHTPEQQKRDLVRMAGQLKQAKIFFWC